MSRKPHRVAELAAYKTGAKKSAAGESDNDRYLRLAAEFDNYKKRTARQYSDVVERANDGLILDLLNIMDDFERAMQSAAPSEDNGGNDNNFVVGIKMIYEKLLSTLKGWGVRPMEVLNKPFDPVFHEAIMQVPSDKEEGTVLDIVAPGYMIKDRVIRHAKVVVASSNDK